MNKYNEGIKIIDMGMGTYDVNGQYICADSKNEAAYNYYSSNNVKPGQDPYQRTKYRKMHLANKMVREEKYNVLKVDAEGDAEGAPKHAIAGPWRGLEIVFGKIVSNASKVMVKQFKQFDQLIKNVKKNVKKSG